MNKLILALFVIAATPALAADLTLQIQGLRSTKGAVLISLYKGATGFPGTPEKAARILRVAPKAASISVQFAKLPAGSYAVSFLHDENNNGKLDTNMIGIPKEGIGFSNDPRISFGPPSYEDSAFNVEEGGTKVRATMKYY